MDTLEKLADDDEAASVTRGTLRLLDTGPFPGVSNELIARYREVGARAREWGPMQEAVDQLGIALRRGAPEAVGRERDFETLTQVAEEA